MELKLIAVGLLLLALLVALGWLVVRYYLVTERVSQEQFSVFIHKAKMHVELKDATEPVTRECLCERGVLVKELELAFADIMGTIGLDINNLPMVDYNGTIDSFPAAEFIASRIPRGDVRFDYFQVNILTGQIFITYYNDKRKLSGNLASQLDVDWDRFAACVSQLQSALAAKPLIATLSNSVEQNKSAHFSLTYQLHDATKLQRNRS